MGEFEEALSFEVGVDLSSQRLEFGLFEVDLINFDEVVSQILGDPLLRSRHQILLLQHLHVDIPVAI